MKEIVERLFELIQINRDIAIAVSQNQNAPRDWYDQASELRTEILDLVDELEAMQ